MRTPNLGTVFYAPGDPPADPKELQRFLREELQKIAGAIQLLADGFDPVVYVAPAKPRKGMRRYADGTSWNPSGGAGLYMYNGSAWVLVKAL